MEDVSKQETVKMRKENNTPLVGRMLDEYDKASPEDKKEIVEGICALHGTLVCRVIVQLDKCRIRK